MVRFQGRYVRAPIVTPLSQAEYADIERVDKTAIKLKGVIQKKLPPDVELFYDPNQDKNHLIIRNARNRPVSGTKPVDPESPLFQMCEGDSRVLSNCFKLDLGYSSSEKEAFSNLKKSFKDAISYALKLVHFWPAFCQFQIEKEQMQQGLASTVQVNFNSILVHVGINALKDIVNSIKLQRVRLQDEMPEGLQLHFEAYSSSKTLYCHIQMDPQMDPKDTLWENMRALGLCRLNQKSTSVQIGRLKAIWNFIRGKEPIEIPETFSSFIDRAIDQAKLAKQAQKELTPVVEKLGQLKKNYPTQFLVLCNDLELMKCFAVKKGVLDLPSIQNFYHNLKCLEKNLQDDPTAIYKIRRYYGPGTYDEQGHYQNSDDGLNISLSHLAFSAEKAAHLSDKKNETEQCIQLINHSGQLTSDIVLHQDLRNLLTSDDFVQLGLDFSQGEANFRRFKEVLEANNKIRSAFYEQFKSIAVMKLWGVDSRNGPDLNLVSDRAERYNQILKDFQRPLEQFLERVQAHFPERKAKVELSELGSVSVELERFGYQFLWVSKHRDESLEGYVKRLNSTLDAYIENKRQTDANKIIEPAKKVYADPGFEV